MGRFKLFSGVIARDPSTPKASTGFQCASAEALAKAEGGRSSTPETPSKESKSHGVLDTPLCGV
jgi:hypothetical protein